SPPATRADVFALLGQIHARRPQRVVAAPLLVRQANLWRQRLPADTWAGVRALYCTGADLDPVEVQRFHAAEGLPVLNYYGLTETVVGGVFAGPAADGGPPGSIGRPVDCELRIVDAEGQPVAEGE
ncbi:AMP-binding protein, partial [Escherichia coli]|uniref:AMP-binding protein n=1 Tax=Escherichia coli TaxID=562 RepID=UPI001981B948